MATPAIIPKLGNYRRKLHHRRMEEGRRRPDRRGRVAVRRGDRQGRDGSDQPGQRHGAGPLLRGRRSSCRCWSHRGHRRAGRGFQRVGVRPGSRETGDKCAEVESAIGTLVAAQRGGREAPRQFAAGAAPVSPRARSLAQREGLDPTQPGRQRAGWAHHRARCAGGARSRGPKLSPVAQARLAEGGFVAPERGSGPGGRVMTRDLRPAEEERVDKAEVDKETRESRETRRKRSRS